MSTTVSVSLKVQRIIPTLGSASDGEALGACRAIGRVLSTSGQTFHDLAQAVQTKDISTSLIRSVGGASAPPTRSATGSRFEGYRYDYQPSRRPRYDFTPKQSQGHRLTARWCLRRDHGRLNDRERAFVSDIANRHTELSIRQADWLNDIALKLENMVPA